MSIPILQSRIIHRNSIKTDYIKLIYIFPGHYCYLTIHVYVDWIIVDDDTGELLWYSYYYYYYSLLRGILFYICVCIIWYTHTQTHTHILLICIYNMYRREFMTWMWNQLQCTDLCIIKHAWNRFEFKSIDTNNQYKILKHMDLFNHILCMQNFVF